MIRMFLTASVFLFHLLNGFRPFPKFSGGSRWREKEKVMERARNQCLVDKLPMWAFGHTHTHTRASSCAHVEAALPSLDHGGH